MFKVKFLVILAVILLLSGWTFGSEATKTKRRIRRFSSSFLPIPFSDCDFYGCANRFSQIVPLRTGIFVVRAFRRLLSKEEPEVFARLNKAEEELQDFKQQTGKRLQKLDQEIASISSSSSAPDSIRFNPV